MTVVSHNRSENGLTYVSVILLILAAAAIYGTYVFAPIYLADWNFEREVDGQLIKAAELSDSDIREYLLRQAGILKIPIDEGAGLEIKREEGQITISYKYDRTTPIPGLETVHFDDSKSRRITKVQHLFHH